MGGTENNQTRNINPAANIVATIKNKTTVGNMATPTPVDVVKLELSLVEHPDPNFVAQLCTNLRYGAHIGFKGKRAPRFSKNLPTALAQPDIISSNLAHEISLGRVAGPFDNPPFPNFQVSPIGLVPKSTRQNFGQFSICLFPSRAPQASMPLFQKMILASNMCIGILEHIAIKRRFETNYIK
jgi:hypothetical protein